jgi:hypothetical protein
MMGILAYLVARLKEPSTYAGLASLLGLVGINLAPEHLTAIISIATAIAAGIAVFVPDLSKPAE